MFTMESKFTPFIGLHYGITDGSIVDGTATMDDKGAVYGAQVGALYAITNNIEFEANLAYSKSNFDSDIQVNGVTVANAKYELDKSTSLYVGFNYKF
ncbi:MAG: hypothetical protein Q9M43_02410 [Sulfurimonas sp.]|nr:hypothetical protein [Sulfurimonas sp.]